jgi:hypothetical protein
MVIPQAAAAQLGAGKTSIPRHPLAANEEIETTDWPHPSFLPLNYSASRVLAFFNAGMKSRMTQSPWHNGQVRLENGFSNVPGIADVRPPKPEPFNTRPAA